LNSTYVKFSINKNIMMRVDGGAPVVFLFVCCCIKSKIKIAVKPIKIVYKML